ncbi:hypothetical protein HYT92_00515 [Candidatus Pacearchaeota archaeon]|nr:hypothetical protein [Candidatus Pacearchaeota archaeon]
MGVSSILLLVISIIMLAEGIGYMLFTKKMKKITDKIFKKDMIAKEIGLKEIIIALAIILITLLV